jgi:hypothetical protein
MSPVKTGRVVNRAGTEQRRQTWSLPALMEGLHERVERDLRLARELIGHSPTKGEASQNVWIKLFENYLPERYQARSATIVDSEGEFSDQIDVVIYDRQYSPFLLHAEGQAVIPVEAVYAVFESKQEVQGHFVRYAQAKTASVRRLSRTSVKVPTISGAYVKTPQPIVGGFLALDARRNRSLAGELTTALKQEQEVGRLDLGCVAALGTFGCGGADSTTVTLDKHAATSFLLELMSRLQACGTVPAIDYRAYARSLNPLPALSS